MTYVELRAVRSTDHNSEPASYSRQRKAEILLMQMAELDPTPETPRTPLEKVQQFYNNLVEKAKAASPLHRRGASNGRNAFKSDTPTSAKAGGNTVQLTATSRS